MVQKFETMSLVVQLFGHPTGSYGRSRETLTTMDVDVAVSFDGPKWRIKLLKVARTKDTVDPELEPDMLNVLSAIRSSVVGQLTELRHKQLLEQFPELLYGYRDADPVLLYNEKRIRLSVRPAAKDSPSVRVIKVSGEVIQEVLCTDLDKPLEDFPTCFTVLLDDLKITMSTLGRIVNIVRMTYE